MTLFPRLRAGLRHFAQSESGTVTMDFAIVLPVFLAILFSSLEAGMTMTRIVLMDRALDLTVRELRIGAMGQSPNHNIVRARLCDFMVMLPNCTTSVKLEMQIINRNNWQGFTTPRTCIDRTVDVEPVLGFSQGGSNEIVTVRACAVYDVIFPTTRWGLGLPLDASGGHQIASMAAFVNEPR